MGNTLTNEDALPVFERLMMMGYEDELSFMAANKYPKMDDIPKAMDYIEKLRKKRNTKQINNANECDDNHCIVLSQEIIPKLQFYRDNHQRYNDENMSEYFINHGQYLLNSYHHILQYHLSDNNDLNKELKMIFNEIMRSEHELNCDIKTCKIYLRHNNIERKNEINEINEKNDNSDIKIYINLFDTIHCFFIHSIDIGYFDNDKEFPVIHPKLTLKRKYLEEIKGSQRMNNNKFNTMNYDFKKNKINFGNCFDYLYNKNDNNYIAKKYLSLKIEILKNKIYSIDIIHFNLAFKKSMFLINKSNYIKSIKSKINNDNINIENILALILYIDYDILCYHFRMTFYNDSINNKNKEYFNWTKKLCQTINCFGDNINNNNNIKDISFYRGIRFNFIHTSLVK